MSKRSRWLPIYLVGLFVVAGALALSGQAGGSRPRVEVAPAAGDRLPDIAGTWTGTWEDTIYDASGDMSWTINIEGPAMNANGIIDVWDVGFGIGLSPGTADGTITAALDRSTLDFIFTAAAVGSGMGSITDNTATGSGTMVPPMDFGDFTLQATVTDVQMRGTFDFTEPGGGAGKVLMTKETPVEDSSWGAVKDRYRDGSE